MDRRLKGRAQAAITRRIAFVRATKPDASDVQMRAKLGRPLNAPAQQHVRRTEEEEAPVGTPPRRKEKKTADVAAFEVAQGWGPSLAHRGIGAGLSNFGNSALFLSFSNGGLTLLLLQKKAAL